MADINPYKVGDRVTFQEPGDDTVWHGAVIRVESATEIDVRFDGESGYEPLYTSEVNPEK